MTYWARGSLCTCLFGKTRCTFVHAVSAVWCFIPPALGRVQHHSGKDTCEDNHPLMFKLHIKNPHTEPLLKEAIIKRIWVIRWVTVFPGSWWAEEGPEPYGLLQVALFTPGLLIHFLSLTIKPVDSQYKSIWVLESIVTQLHTIVCPPQLFNYRRLNNGSSWVCPKQLHMRKNLKWCIKHMLIFVGF